ncbi:MAG: HD domain-containing protein, partial [Microgenomates group bacterium]
MKTKTNKTGSDLPNKLSNFFFEIGTLRKLARSHRQALLTDDLSDNIASHSYRVVMIGWFLANLEKVDPYKVVTMCLFHDTAESRGGDQNWINKKYVKVFEDEIHDNQLRNLPFGEDLHRINQEYNDKKTREAIIAKDADL